MKYHRTWSAATLRSGLLALATGLLVVGLSGCPDIFGPQNNPLDPGAIGYQGFETVDTPDAIYPVALTQTVYGWAPTLESAAVAGSGSYGLRVERVSDGIWTVVYEGQSDTRFFDLSPADLTAGDYRFAVRAMSASGTWGAWKGEQQFTLTTEVTGLSPSDESATDDRRPAFTWSSVPDAASYQLRLFVEGTAAPAPVVVNAASHSPSTDLTQNTRYSWQVRAVNADGGVTAWSTVHHLTVGWPAPTGLSPADGAVVAESSPTVSWSPVNGAASYEVQAGLDSTTLGSQSTVAATGSSREFPFALEPGQTAYWRVRAKDAAGTFSAWSAIRSVAYQPGWAESNYTFITVVDAGNVANFQMGSASGDGDEAPVHSVTLARPFEMSTYEMTNAQVAAVLNEAVDRGLVTATQTTVQNAAGNEQELVDLDGSARLSWNGSDLVVETGYENHPAVEVSWYGALAIAHYLNTFEGREQTVDLSDWSVDFSKSGYRLPTEAEWEYAARGGASATDTTYAGSNTVGDVAWYSANSGSTAQAVGTKAANEIGLYDMSGNLWEWVADWYGAYGSGEKVNPAGPGTAAGRVIRGGSWGGAADIARVTNRETLDPTLADYSLGFRLVRTSTPPAAIVGLKGPAGGTIFYDKGTHSDGWRFLEAAATDQSDDLQWGGYGMSIPGTSTTLGAGPSNTSTIVATLGAGSYAARICYDLVLGGYDDWFLPSKDELNQMFVNRAVLPEIAAEHYWTSTENRVNYSWHQHLATGATDDNLKYDGLHVRAIRRF